MTRTVARRLLTSAITTTVGVVYRIETRGLARFSRAPSTIIVANHLRDSDVPILTTALYGNGGGAGRGSLPHYVAREDLFRRGFLAAYLRRAPAPLRPLLRRLDLAPVLTLLQAHPMRRVPERTLGEVLSDVLRVGGDAPLDRVLRPAALARFASFAPSGSPPATVRGALDRRFRALLREPGGLYRLTREWFAALKPYHRRVIDAQLQAFVTLLDEGATVNLEPEGVAVADGSFTSLRGALHRLVNEPRADIRALPVCLSYDSMINGRERAIVGVGPELRGLRGLDRADLERRVGGAILAEFTVTATHLASRLLEQLRAAGRDTVTAAELSGSLAAEARRLAGEGVHVDPLLLDDARRRRRLARLLVFCERRGLLLRAGGDAFRLGARGAGHCAAALVEHAGTELRSALARPRLGAP